MMGIHHTIRVALMLSSLLVGGRLLADEGERVVAAEINKGNELLRGGDVDGAVKAYGQVQAGAPDRADVSYNMAVAKYRKGDMAAAEQLFKQTSTSEDDALAAKARYNLGNCNYASAIKQAEADRPAAIKGLQNAIDNYRSALDIDPNDADSRANIELASAMIEKLREQEKKQQQQQQQQDQKQQDQKQDQQKQDQQQNKDQQQKDDKQKDDKQKDDKQKDDKQKDDKQNEQKQKDAKSSDQQQQKDSQQEQNKDQQKDQQQSQKDQQQKPENSQEKENKSKGDQSAQDQQQKPGEEAKDKASEKNESQSKEQKQQESKPEQQDSKSQSQESKSQSQDQKNSAGSEQKQQPESKKEPQSSPDKSSDKSDADKRPEQSQQQKSQTPTQKKPADKDSHEKDAAQPSEQPKDEKGNAAPKGSLTAADQKDGKTDPKGKELVAKPEMVQDGAMTTQEAEKMLQAIRDQEMIRRLKRQAAERNQHVPVDRDW